MHRLNQFRYILKHRWLTSTAFKCELFFFRSMLTVSRISKLGLKIKNVPTYHTLSELARVVDLFNWKPSDIEV